MDIANAILRCRRARQLRQADVASRAGISEAYLSLLERGLRNDPSLTTLTGIAEAMEVPLPVLVAIALEDEPSATAKEPALSDLTTAASHLMTNGL